MATELELALMAYRAYGQSDTNKISLSPWSEEAPTATSSGFAGSVYTKDNEVVIAFRGTDFDSTGPIVEDFWNGNIPAARGSYSDQVMDAIKLVADTMAAHPGANITFTGHSLGGGMTSMPCQLQ